MSTVFSFNRLGRLVAKQYAENLRLYVFSFIALFGLLAITFAFWAMGSFPRWHEEPTYIIFVFGLFISGSVFASMTFKMLGSRDKGLYWLGIPATHAEKLVCAILYSTVFFTLLYCVCFFLVKGIVVALLEQYIASHPGAVYTRINGFDTGFTGMLKYFVYGFFAVQALYLLGSVYFSRFAFILTSIIGAVFIFIFIFYLYRLNRAMFESSAWDLVSVRRFGANPEEGFLLYSISPFATDVLKYVSQFIWAPVFWIVTWFRLKEKEV